MTTLSQLIGMLKSPRATLAEAIARPRSLDAALMITLVSAACSVSFLMTRVGRLAGLDEQVRQLESLGVVVADQRYATLRAWEPYRPLLSGAAILIGWPVMWIGAAAVIRAIANRASEAKATFAQVLTVIVHASAVLMLRAVVSAPLNYLRESLGGATSLGALVPGLGDATFAARLFGALDIFVLWWVLLVAVGLGMLYHTRAMSMARWLLGAYATGAAALAWTQALRGGV